MENLTLGDVSSALIFIITLVGSIITICTYVKKALNKAFEPIQEELRAEKVARLKASLVNYMALAEQDMLIGKQKENAYEEYDEYISLGQNSYIHQEWERLQNKGKL